MADPRITPARGDLAALHLKGLVEADRFVPGVAYEIADGVAPVRRAPSPDAALETQALRGERVTIYDRNDDGWAWGQLENDAYVGWLPDAALRMMAEPLTHRVMALRTLAFPGPSIKLPPRETLPLGARLTIVRRDDTFAITSDGFYIPARHVAPLASVENDFVAVAERFVGTPYLWGGRTSLGIDCSGLVQIALATCGMSAPRDSDMQEAAFEPRGLTTENLMRGDLIFWSGHVAIVRDARTLVHANAFHMATAIESIEDAVARIAAAGSAVTSVRRPI